MSDAESLMWRLEKDPYLSSTVANLTVLDSAPDMERLAQRMIRATRIVARLRQRVKPALGLQPPVWVDDHDFDLSYHLRRLALAPPGDERELYDLATLLTADPFDRTRPLWQMVIIEGLSGGRAALLMRFHHTLMDGEGGVRLSLQFLDFERDAPEEPLPPEVEAVAPPPTASPAEVARDVVTSTLRVPMGLAREASDLFADPRRIPSVSAAAAASLRAIVRELSDTKRALSPLWTQRSLSRRLETLQVPFDDVKTAAKELGGSINTAFITAATEAAGRYHQAHGASVEELRASMAISTRTRDTKESNAFTLARMAVPAGEMSIEERFKRIQEATDTARSESGQANLNVFAGVAAALPTSLLVRLARQQTETVDFGTSNVRGSPVHLYLAGARVEANYPIGPTGGTAFNLTLLSYAGSLDMGLNIDAAAVASPGMLRNLMVESFEDLVKRGAPVRANTPNAAKAAKAKPEKKPAKKS
jgi:diacylglycerol O-acyltransferase / wax synthase